MKLLWDDYALFLSINIAEFHWLCNKVHCCELIYTPWFLATRNKIKNTFLMNGCHFLFLGQYFSCRKTQGKSANCGLSSGLNEISQTSAERLLQHLVSKPLQCSTSCVVKESSKDFTWSSKPMQVSALEDWFKWRMASTKHFTKSYLVAGIQHSTLYWLSLLQNGPCKFLYNWECEYNSNNKKEK